MASLTGYEVLLVEDAAQYRLIARRILEGDGALVYEAEGVDAGLKIAAEKIPHLIITDIEMPEKTGFDLIAAVKATPQLAKIPILVLSGLTDRKSVFKAISMGAKDYMVKPFYPPGFLQKVKKALQLATFGKFAFEAGREPAVSLSCQAEVLSGSEIGILIESPVKLGANVEIGLESEVLTLLGCPGALLRTFGAGRLANEGRYVNELNLMGLCDKETRRIRQILGKK